MDPELVYTSDGDVGTPFVTGNLVRLEAGSSPGTLQVAYTVRDLLVADETDDLIRGGYNKIGFSRLIGRAHV